MYSLLSSSRHLTRPFALAFCKFWYSIQSRAKRFLKVFMCYVLSVFEKEW